MKAIFKQGRIGEKKMFIMYTSDSMGSNQRFLRKLPRGYGRQYPSHSQWVSIVRARHIAAAYLSEPRSPRFAPSSNGSVPEPAFDGSLHGSVFDMSSLKDALPEPASPGSLHGSAFDMSSMLHALPDPDPTFDMGPLMDALPDPNGAFNMRSLSDALSESAPKPRGFASDMSSLMRALPNPDASSDVSSLVHVPKPVIAPRARKSRELPPKARRTRVVQTYVQVGPFSTTCFFSLCGVLLVLGPIFPQLLPAFYAALVLQFIYGTCFS
ncbi:uncharacterized protein N7479_010400 [Penicillium vulpinum]|nr:uncharacterized protein N7479_010400 [Penicillium vulpinum]KAJ5951987.1 hypothetical protein N7479_010400 [Penicillium vulpinum]